MCSAFTFTGVFVATVASVRSLNLQADIAYVTILERIQIYYSHVRNYEIANGRPNLEKFLEEMNTIEAYKQTKNQPLILLEVAKRHLKARSYSLIKFDVISSPFFVLNCIDTDTL
jgi:hypothetical protein